MTIREKCIELGRYDLIEMLDYETSAKEGIDIDRISHGSEKKVFWKCDKGNPHSYPATFNHKRGGRGCPYCSVPPKKILPGWNDMETYLIEINRQDLILQWNVEENDGLTLQEISKNKKNTNYWWNYTFDGEQLCWQSTIKRRLGGVDTPTDFYNWCIINDRRDIIDEFEAADNEKQMIYIYKGSNKEKYNFICNECKKKYPMTPNDRTSGGSGCPDCANKIGGKKKTETAVLKNGSFLLNHPEFAKEWDNKKNECSPNEICSYTNKKYWFVCSFCGSNYDASPNQLINNKRKCQCLKKSNNSFIEFTIRNCLKTCFAIEKQRFNKKQPELDIILKNVRIAGKKVAIEIDGIYHKQNKMIQKDKDKNIWCNDNDIHLIRIRENKLPDIRQINILKEKMFVDNTFNDEICDISYYTFEHYSFEEYIKISKWIIKYINFYGGYDLKLNVNEVNFYEMLLLFKQRSSHSEESLEITNPELLDEWDYEKNKGLKPSMFTKGSHERVNWICKKCGHEWPADIRARAIPKKNREKGTGCPKCANKVRGEKMKSGRKKVML